MLQRLDENLWIAAAPLSMLGLRLGTRMTVVRLAGGGLWVHSPVAPSTELRAAVDALGTVRHVVAPNLYHHLWAGHWKTAYPRALLHGPARLAKKRRDLAFDAALSETPHADWASDLDPLHVDGCMLDETVFVHRASRTVVASDLTENFTANDHFPTRLYLKIGGIYGRAGWSRLLRFMYRDRAAARRSVDRLLEREFDRLVIALGDLIERDARDRVRETFRFLH